MRFAMETAKKATVVDSHTKRVVVEGKAERAGKAKAAKAKAKGEVVLVLLSRKGSVIEVTVADSRTTEVAVAKAAKEGRGKAGKAGKEVKEGKGREEEGSASLSRKGNAIEGIVASSPTRHYISRQHLFFFSCC